MNFFFSAQRLFAATSGAMFAVALLNAAASERELAYISNQDAQIAVIDLTAQERIADIDSGASSPRGIGITADGKLLVTANGQSGDLSIIDRASGALRKRVPIGKNPEFVRIRGDFAFVSFEPAAVGGPPPAPGSEAAAALAKEREDDDAEPARIAVIDLQQGKVVREIVGGMETEGIEFSADGKRLLITNEADDNVSVHDIASGKLLRRISTKKYGSRPRGIKVAPDGKSYGVTLEYGNKLLILDTAFKVKKVIPTGDTPYGLAFDRAGKRILVALAKGGAIQVFDAKTFTEIGRGTTGKRCWHFTFTPNDQQILVACGKSNEVVVLDANSLQEVKRYPDFKTPWGVITWPKSVGSLDQP